MPGPQLPKDIVAIDSGDRSYMFYVNKDGKLSYLISPDARGSGNFSSKVIEINDSDVQVKPDTTQVAAVNWEADGIRVYYVDTDGWLQEVCNSSNKQGWYQGSLGDDNSEKHAVAIGSSISATVHKYPGKWSLRVFASKKDQTNKYGNPNISVYKFNYNELDEETGQWAGAPVTNEIHKW